VNTEKSFLQDLAIVIVIFERNPLDSDAFRSLNLIRNGAMVILYDNSPISHEHKIPKIENVIYHHDPSNPGVSKAYNVAANIARKINKRWLLLADQDTTFPNQFLEKYQHAVQKYSGVSVFCPRLLDSIGFVSPFLFTRGKGSRAGVIEAETYELKKFRFANSGLLVSLDAFDEAGGYDERFPLDYSDIVFADRLATVHRYFVLVDVQCDHRFSGSEKESGRVLLKRFDSFCNAAFLYKEIAQGYVPLYSVLLPRAIKLSLQTRNLHFLKLAWKSLTV
jgi:rhamnosyltransferase